jgi:ribose transport system ATP-binding protein
LASHDPQHDASGGPGAQPGPPGVTAGAAPILTVRGLAKAFGNTRALDGVSLDVAPAEIHALLGHNGSGKSTLIKLLSGYHAPDAGSVAIRGEEVSLPLAAVEQQRLGLRFVHQDLGLVPSISVLENLRVGRFETRAGGRIAWRAERARTRELLRRFDLDVDPDAPVARLSQTERAIVAVLRGLQDMDELGGGLVVLDEPTASLPANEVHRLFDAMRRVTEQGSSVLFVTHRVDEVLEICDRASVLREGKLVATVRVAELDAAGLVRLIVGRDLGDLYPDAVHSTAGTVLSAEAISGAVVREATFSVREGEILGLTGLLGAGHDEVPYLLFGADPLAGGAIVDAEHGPLHPSPESSLAAGIALLPADRLRLAGIPRATVRENITLPALKAYRRRRGLDRARERRDAADVVRRISVVPADTEANLGALSGGNQQKALLGRSVLTRPRVLLLHEPTQGVDIGARQTIFEVLQESAAAGTSVVYSSVEYEDLAHLCDRVLVFRNGRIATELSGAALTHEAIVEASYLSGGST